VSGAVAQLVARFVRIEEVRGSIPRSSTTFSQVRPTSEHSEVGLLAAEAPVPTNCPQIWRDRSGSVVICREPWCVTGPLQRGDSSMVHDSCDPLEVIGDRLGLGVYDHRWLNGRRRLSEAAHEHGPNLGTVAWDWLITTLICSRRTFRRL